MKLAHQFTFIVQSIEKRPIKWLMFFVCGYTSLFVFLSVLKYLLFLYDSIDLAIFNQVFWNTIHGQPFWLTITFPHSYLGDHASLLMILQMPIYALFPHPYTLLILQTVALAGAAIPLFFIAKILWRQSSAPEHYANHTALGIAILWLLNPLVHNVNLIEYHELSFFPLFVFLAVFGYLAGNKPAFLIGYLLAAAVREDTGIMLIGFIAIMMIDILRNKERRRERLWFLAAAITASTVWTMIAYSVINYFSPDGTRYTSYFSWLGNTIPAILQTIFLRPLFVLKNLFSLRNIMVAAVPLLPLFFLPLARPKYLLLAAVPLGALFLTNPNQSTISYIYLHYSAAVIPGVFVSFAAAAIWYSARNSRDKIILATIIIAVSTLYIGFSLGPLVPNNRATLSEIISRRRASARELAFVPPDDAVLTETWLLPALSSRTTLYDLRRIYIGNIEFTTKKYDPPCNVNQAILGQVDLAEMVMREQFIGYANLEHIQRLIACSNSKITLAEQLDLSYDLLAPTPVSPAPAPLIAHARAVKEADSIVITGTFKTPNTKRPSALLWRVETIDPKTQRGAVVFQLAEPLTKLQGVSSTQNFSIAISSSRFLKMAENSGEVRLFLVHNRVEMRPVWLNSLMPIILPPLEIFDSNRYAVAMTL